MRAFLLSRVAIPLHLAFIAGYIACVAVSPDSVSAYLPIAFLAAGLIEVTLLFPSSRRGENVYDARMRVRRAFFGDPIFILGAFGLLFLAMQTLNGPRAIVYNAMSGKWMFATARIRDFPACVDRIGALHGVFWSLLSIPAILAVRCGIGKNGRLLLLRYLLAISTVSAIVALALYDPESADTGKYSFATFSSPVSAAMYFFMNFCVADGMYAYEVGEEERSASRCRLTLLACLANAAGIVYSLSRLGLVMFVMAFLVILVYGIVYLATRITAAEKIRMFVGGVIIIGAVAFLHYVAYPSNRIHGSIEKIISMEWVSEEEKADHDVRVEVARRMAKDNMWAGVGTWGYANSECFGKYMDDDDWEKLADEESTPACADCDAVQFAAEYGLFGVCLLGSPFAILLLSTLWRIAFEFRPRKKQPTSDSVASTANESHPFTERVSPLAFTMFLAVFATFGISFRFSIFRDPQNLLQWAIFAAIMPTLFPKPKKNQA